MKLLGGAACGNKGPKGALLPAAPAGWSNPPLFLRISALCVSRTGSVLSSYLGF